MENIPICRVCMQKSPEFVDFDMPLQNENEEDTNITYLDFFYECTRIEVEPHELGSQCFCLPCGDELRSFHKFVKIAEMTDKILKENILRANKPSRKTESSHHTDTWFPQSNTTTKELLDTETLRPIEDFETDSNCHVIPNEQLVGLQVEIFKDKTGTLKADNREDVKINCGKSSEGQKLHPTEVISNKDPIECAFCGEVLKNRRLLNKHLIEEHQTRAQPCGLCGKMVIRMREHLLIHYRKKNALSRPKTECPVCFRIVSKQTIARHIQYVHKHEIKKQKCPQCCQTFADAHKLKVHLSKGHSSGTCLKCPLCYRTFSKMISLNNHLRIHPCLNKIK